MSTREGFATTDTPAAMKAIRAEFDRVAADIRAVYNERPQLYKAIIAADAIALEWLRDTDANGE